MKVLVTGGAGFIGANLCRRLVATPAVAEVVVVDDLSTGARENLDGTDVVLLEGSLLDEGLLEAAAEGADAIVHLAARGSVPRSVREPGATHAANTVGTLAVLEAARHAGSPHVVVASSSSVYGANPTLPKREDLATRPLSPYAATKLATEAYALAWQACYDLPVLVFRFFNVYGPLQPAGHAYAAVIPSFVDAALQGRPVEVHGDGTQSRDFTFVDSVVAVVADALARRVTDPEPVNLAFGTRTDLLTVLDLVESELGRPVERRHVAPRAGDVPHSQACDERLRSLFPDVEPVPVRDGIARTVAWFREQAAQAGSGRS